MIIFVIFLNLCNLSNCLYGTTLLGLLNFGDQVSGLTARSVGMGSVGIATLRDPSALSVNPATIANIPASKMIVSATPSYFMFSEKENVLDMTSDNVYFQLGSIGLAAPVIKDLLVIGVNNSPVLDYSYKTDYKFDDPETMTKMLEQRAVSSGGLRRTDVGLGLKIIDELQAGFSYVILGGNEKSKIESTWYNNNQPFWTVGLDTSTDYTGNSVRYGLVFNQAPYNFGAFYQSSAMIDRNATQTVTNIVSGVATSTMTVYKEELKYPESFGFGFSYQFKDKFRTLFAADWTRQNWNALAYRVKTINDAATGEKMHHLDGYGKADELNLGLEMWLNDWIPVRCGFKYQESYWSWKNNVNDFYHSSVLKKEVLPVFYCFSFGSGYVMERFDIDFGYEFASRSYETNSFERIDEDLQRLVLTTRFRW